MSAKIILGIGKKCTRPDDNITEIQVIIFTEMINEIFLSNHMKCLTGIYDNSNHKYAIFNLNSYHVS